jgi:hypothetical protein
MENMTMRTTKTLMFAFLIVGAIMSGCLTDAETTKEATTIERMTQLEAILTDPEVSEEEKVAAYTLSHEAITGGKHKLNPETNVTPTPEIEHKIVSVTVRQGSTDIIGGVSELIVTIQGGEDYDQLKKIEVLVNNISLNTYPAEYQIERKIECKIIGTWNVKVDGIFTDGTIQTLINTSGFELRKSEDTPNIGAFKERYIETSDKQMSREEAKALCDELGIVWGDDRNIPIEKPTLTSTKVTPKVIPTPTVIITPKQTRTFRGAVLAYGYQDGQDRIMVRLDAIQHEMIWIESFTVELNGQYIGTVERRDTGNTKPLYDFDAIIILPDEMTHHDGEIIITGSMIDSNGCFVGYKEINCLLNFPPEKYSCYSRNLKNYIIINN